MKINVKIFILNWNGGAVLIDCLESVLKIQYKNLDIIVIDNNSSDNSINDIHIKFPGVQVIALNDNYGYAKAYNKAFELTGYSEDSFFMLLNNDTIVDINIIDELLNTKKKLDIKKYIFGPKIYYLNNPEIIWYSGGRVNLPIGMIEHIGIRQKDDSDMSSLTSTDYITGCCIFTHSLNIEKLNGFDERFNMYCEDVDFSIRAINSGVKCIYVPDAILWHKVSNSFSNEFSFSKISLKFSSILKLYKKHVKWNKRYFGLVLVLFRNLFSAVKLLFARFNKSN